MNTDEHGLNTERPKVGPVILDDSVAKPAPMSRWVDAAYLSPMAAFLLLTWAGGHWPKFFELTYILKSVFAAALLVYFWKYYTRIRWTHWQLGVLVGIVGVVQWVGMEKLLLHFWEHYPRISAEIYKPMERGPDGALLHFRSIKMMWAFIAIRWAGASLVVPVMEELFWRDYLWRTMLAPNDIRLAEVGEWDWKAFVFVALAFSTVHIQWVTAIVWGLLIGWLLVKTKSLGACIIAHGVTNLLLGGYVLWQGDWYFW